MITHIERLIGILLVLVMATCSLSNSRQENKDYVELLLNKMTCSLTKKDSCVCVLIGFERAAAFLDPTGKECDP